MTRTLILFFGLILTPQSNAIFSPYIAIEMEAGNFLLIDEARADQLNLDYPNSVRFNSWPEMLTSIFMMPNFPQNMRQIRNKVRKTLIRNREIFNNPFGVKLLYDSEKPKFEAADPIMFNKEQHSSSLFEIVRAKGKLSEDQVWVVGKQVLDILGELHRKKKLIHQGVNPRNILISSTYKAQLVGFEAATKSGEIFTRNIQDSEALVYLPPGISEGLVLPKSSVDLFSLGYSLVFALTR